jgi:hypothetical protein
MPLFEHVTNRYPPLLDIRRIFKIFNLRILFQSSINIGFSQEWSSISSPSGLPVLAFTDMFGRPALPSCLIRSTFPVRMSMSLNLCHIFKSTLVVL